MNHTNIIHQEFGKPRDQKKRDICGKTCIIWEKYLCRLYITKKNSLPAILSFETLQINLAVGVKFKNVILLSIYLL